jgi:glutathione synthase/RimK-type ligase-like ATP-grasp enzyme
MQFRGADIELRRPSALDLLEALQVSKDTPERLYAWFVLRHLMQDGKPVFASIDEVLASYAPLVSELGSEIQRLYEEGRD